MTAVPLTEVARQPAPPTDSSTAIADVEIDRLRDLLHLRPTAALSLDCFDTVLWRAVPKPVDAFMLVGERLRDVGALVPGVTPGAFVRMRILAEQLVRRQAVASRGTGEVHLAEIYSLPGWQRQTGLLAPELARHELLVERSITTADPRLALLLDELASEDPPRTVLVVSDSYLDATSLRFLLEGAGLSCLLDVPIFTSCEHGIPKARGLLGLALRQLELDPADCIHVGDNLDADVRPALQLGLSTIHLPAWTPLAHRTLAVEGWMGDGTAPAAELLDPVAGDSGLTALRGRIARRRPRSVAADDAIYWDLGATTLGPVFSGFAEWVHERADALGIDTALCCMREGRLLAQLLDGVPDDRRRCVAVPFWASREACVRATFFSANREELSRIRWRMGVPTPHQVLETLGVRLEEIEGGQAIVDAMVASGRPAAERADAFLDFVAARQDVRDLIVERSAARRRVFVEHLVQSVAGAGRTVALVDLGFGATIQAALHDMVRAEGVPLDFRGLYLFTSPRALVRQLGGTVVEGFLADTGSPRARFAVLDRSPEILEVLATTDDGSLLELAPGGKPVLASRPPQNEQDRRRVLVQSGITDFQRAWYELDKGTLATRVPLGRSPDALHRILSRFVATPGTEVARALSRWEHEANFGSACVDPLVPEALERCAPHLAPEHLAAAGSDNVYWVGAAATYGGMADPVRWLQEGLAEPGTFLGDGRGGRLLLAPETAAAGSDAASTPLVLHPRGAGVVAWHGRSTGQRFVLRTSGPSAVLRLDGVRVERADGTVETFEWGPERRPTLGLDVTAGRAVAEGVALVSGTDAIALCLSTDRPTPVTTVEVLYGALPA